MILVSGTARCDDSHRITHDILMFNNDHALLEYLWCSGWSSHAQQRVSFPSYCSAVPASGGLIVLHCRSVTIWADLLAATYCNHSLRSCI